MNHVYTERALQHMDWEIRQAEIGVFAFYEGYPARISIDEAILLAESYLPAGAATRVVRNND